MPELTCSRCSEQATIRFYYRHGSELACERHQADVEASIQVHAPSGVLDHEDVFQIPREVK